MANFHAMSRVQQGEQTGDLEVYHWQGELKSEDVSFRFQRYVFAYREQQHLLEDFRGRVITMISIPMLKSLETVKIAGFDWFRNQKHSSADDRIRSFWHWSSVWHDLFSSKLIMPPAVTPIFDNGVTWHSESGFNAITASSSQVEILKSGCIAVNFWQRRPRLSHERTQAGL
ncbi:hypothetical protein MMC28_004332 [Mycoblastus sanguinarius]|nr:hypothetical protein [Mycoblastus sanguinarius]